MMTTEAAKGLLDKAAQDQAFARQLDEAKSDNDKFVGVARDAGFDVTADEVRAEYLERHGAELDAAQLDSVAAGADLASFGFLVINPSATGSATGGTTGSTTGGPI